MANIHHHCHCSYRHIHRYSFLIVKSAIDRDTFLTTGGYVAFWIILYNLFSRTQYLICRKGSAAELLLILYRFLPRSPRWGSELVMCSFSWKCAKWGKQIDLTTWNYIKMVYTWHYIIYWKDTDKPMYIPYRDISDFWQVYLDLLRR